MNVNWSRETVLSNILFLYILQILAHCQKKEVHAVTSLWSGFSIQSTVDAPVSGTEVVKAITTGLKLLMTVRVFVWNHQEEARMTSDCYCFTSTSNFPVTVGIVILITKMHFFLHVMECFHITFVKKLLFFKLLLLILSLKVIIFSHHTTITKVHLKNSCI